MGCHGKHYTERFVVRCVTSRLRMVGAECGFGDLWLVNSKHNAVL